MTTIASNTLAINGIIDTNQSVLDNITELANASGCWVTFDVVQGKWAVVINRAGSSIFSFDDSNIIGNINVSGTGVTELYNKVEIQFPHKDLIDQTDVRTLSIAAGDRFDNEIDNVLNITTNLTNDPIQAEYLASLELKQNRIDKIIQFRTDFSALGLKAGDLIDVTSEVYGYTNKVFRILSIAEDDDDQGNLILSITAFEYDNTIYNTNGLVRESRSNTNNVISKCVNQEIQALDDVDAGNQLGRLLAANVLTGLLNSAFQTDPETGIVTQTIGPASEELESILTSARKPPLTSINGPESVCEGETITITLGHSCDSCLFDIPDFDYPYEITGVFEEDVDVPLIGTVTISGGAGSITINTTSSAGGSGSQTLSFTCGGANTTVTIYDVLDYTYSTVASQASIDEGQSVTFTVTTTNVPDSTSIGYVLSGTASSRVSNVPLSGTLTINSNTATLLATVTDDGVYTGEQSLTFTIDPGVPENPCHGTWDFTASVTVNDTDTPPPTPDPDTTCEYVSVPVVWCAIYDGEDDQLKDVSVRHYAYLPVPLAGEASVNVPTALTVTKGNPSTISVSSTTAVATSSNLGGIPFRVITSFNSVGPKGLITGTGSTIYGY